jgi:hypothetical protein
MSDQRHKIISEQYKGTGITTPFVKDCIKSIEKSYKVLVVIPDKLIEDINIMYEITSGCWFMDWLNHRLYSEIVMNCILLGGEVPQYIDWEELEEW